MKRLIWISVSVCLLVACRGLQREKRSRPQRDAAVDAMPGQFGFSVPVYVNARELTFVVDTGASYTTILRRSSSGIDRIRTRKSTGYDYAGNIINVDAGRVASFGIGAIDPVREVELKIIDLDTGNWHFDGLLGWDLLEQLHVTVDFGRGSLGIGREAGAEILQGNEMIGGVFGRFKMLYIRGRVNGAEGYLRLDSGVDRTSVSDAFAASDVKSEQMMSSSGLHEWKSGNIASLEFGGRKYENVTLGLISGNPLTDPFVNGPILGIVGFDWLKLRGVIVDCATGKVYVRTK